MVIIIIYFHSEMDSSSIPQINIHAKDISVESLSTELTLNPLRLEEVEDRGIKFDEDDRNTPLMSAASNGNVEAVKYLLSIGANVEARNRV